MRNKLIVLLIFTLGFTLGVLAAFIFVSKINQRQFAERYALDVIEQASLGTELRANRQVDVTRRIEENLPGYVLAIQHHKELQSTPRARIALRRVKDYYDVNSLPIPNDIADVLNSLPPER
jgi:hypothetical protein